MVIKLSKIFKTRPKEIVPNQTKKKKRRRRLIRRNSSLVNPRGIAPPPKKEISLL